MSEQKESLHVLLAPEGQLCGNGQLRESINERRSRRGENYPMWYLTPSMVEKFNLSSRIGMEAVVAEDPSAIAWLKLRFGGERTTASLDIDDLWENASEPPEPDLRRDIGLNRNNGKFDN